MSIRAVEWVTGKIVLDSSFRDELIAYPDQALSGFELSESEIAWLKHIDFETMESLANIMALSIRNQPGRRKESNSP
ncbi:MAG TPA: Os1348 family NHLP clan protein [Anaerolineaceae bacterium]|nr:Os1348 family NHLP clan protein [Anaerolineaceae bacterium]